ncbi:MAG: BLUF domain-containing protein [Pseudomonadota bacterium]
MRLIYVSTITEKFSGVEIEKILTKSQNNNKKKHISGVLFFNRNNAIQCIEGSAEAVNELYVKVAQDDRHRAVTLIDYRTVCKREFAQWAMGYVAETAKTKEILQPFFTTEQFNSYELSSDSAVHLLCALAQQAPIE